MDNTIKILVMLFIITFLFCLFCLFPCWALHPNNEIQDNNPYCYVRFSEEDPGPAPAPGPEPDV